MRKILPLIAIAVLVGGSLLQASEEPAADSENSLGHQIHESYVAAINSNNLDSLLDILTDDVVFMAPNSPVMMGKAALIPWLEGYLAAYKTHWEKTAEEFVITGEWAFERYSYESTDTSLEDGSVHKDTGWGLVIYHHDADGTWRVARDAWGQDHPPAE